MADKIVVLDFGSQYNQLIARRIREFGVYSELHPHTMTLEEIKALGDVKGIVFSGGPNSVYNEAAPKCDPAIYESGIPILGICYGMQMVQHDMGGKVLPSDKKEYGRTEIKVDTECPIFTGLPETQTVWMSHGDQVGELGEGFAETARSDNTPFAAAANPEKNIYTLQFHPEVRHSEYGNEILKKFVFNVAKAQNNWTMHDFIETQKKLIKEKVKDDKVLLGLSGGVDSSVVAALLHEAIGDQLIAMFIDHGLLRKGEAESVMETFGKNMNINLVKIDAKDRFLSKLEGVSDPEKKRKIIGNEFVYTFDEEVKKLTEGEEIKWLAQGTLYTDVIESGTNSAQTIKSHHNVKGLPEDMQFQLIEPLNTLFKDEVRALGEELGLPSEMVWRQPFPGPGLGIRILGDITEEKLKIVQDSDAILREEIAKARLEKDIWQYFTALTNMRSVGVMGDQRTYDYAVAIRAVTSIDGMTADWARVPFDVLARVSDRIVNEVDHVNRVLFDITSKPPGTIEFE
ncbi:glutamine-hydrolyzing GMP synthase [Ileibacterium valens]|uniref:GMP synthase [glutamine-hydrolyzing] n=1 Tax=Ileibacterium valens TaxID=1862668 RepID=A0A1U7NIL6_9FIRM|nr:glutamine-hydrolyzing GMP synthase [Ileibacterium valens]OLU36666.1 glutamine-hydrolyzing GMP synthase [Erysipelotrichaceae bacterium NYU-BL-F16]OLU40754.1 glutamine-hydrolyzing GMP synthase [Erysipelotrichaceae bacterium NYU-BL-E8]OLU42413.1 glutamine-hydrolyzing GMP synthase [Ileibacterium valens]